MKLLPPTAFELVSELSEQYPEASPDPRDNEREIWMRAGERRLVRVLLLRLKYSKEALHTPASSDE